MSVTLSTFTIIKVNVLCENSQNHFLAIIQTIIESNWSEHENHQYHKRRLKLIRCLYLKVRDIYKLLKQQDFRDEFITIIKLYFILW